jgi:prevent-host-death family protein
MQKATISELKNKLSAYLKKVRAGETVLILDRDEPVARLERVVADEHPDGRLARLERSGLVRRARQPVSVEALRTAAPKATHSVVDALTEERRSGR